MPEPVSRDAKMALPDNQLQVGAFGDVLKMLGATAGLGAAYRGARGLYDMATTPTDISTYRPPLPQRLVPVPVPKPKRPPGEEEEEGLPAIKVAGGPATAPATEFSNPAGWEAQQQANPVSSWLGSHIFNATGALRSPGTDRSVMGDWFFNQNAKDPSGMPWYHMAMPAAMTGGFYGGYKLTDYLLDKSRHNELDSELDYSRRKYQRALLGRGKTASEGESPVDELDVLYDALEKRGIWDWTAPLIGSLGAVGLAGAIGGGILSYDYTRRGNADTALQEALKERKRQIYRQAPAAMLAVPHEIDPDEEEPTWRDNLASGLALTRDQLGALASRAGEGISAGASKAHEGYHALRERLSRPEPSLKAAGVAAAAMATEQRLKQRAQAYYANIAAMQNGGKDAKQAKPTEPAPYQPPSIAHSLRAPAPSAG